MKHEITDKDNDRQRQDTIQVSECFASSRAFCQVDQASERLAWILRNTNEGFNQESGASLDQTKMFILFLEIFGFILC